MSKSNDGFQFSKIAQVTIFSDFKILGNFGVFSQVADAHFLVSVVELTPFLSISVCWFWFRLSQTRKRRRKRWGC